MPRFIEGQDRHPVTLVPELSSLPQTTRYAWSTHSSTSWICRSWVSRARRRRRPVARRRCSVGYSGVLTQPRPGADLSQRRVSGNPIPWQPTRESSFERCSKTQTIRRRRSELCAKSSNCQSRRRRRCGSKRPVRRRPCPSTRKCSPRPCLGSFVRSAVRTERSNGSVMSCRLASTTSIPLLRKQLAPTSSTDSGVRRAKSDSSQTICSMNSVWYPSGPSERRIRARSRNGSNEDRLTLLAKAS